MESIQAPYYQRLPLNLLRGKPWETEQFTDAYRALWEAKAAASFVERRKGARRA